MAGFRAKTYANKQDKANGGKPGHMQLAGEIALFRKVAEGDKDALKELKDAVSGALPK